MAMPGPVRKFMTAADKNLLINLFEEKREILSQRAKGSQRNKWKKAVWDAIAAEFNSTDGISASRTPEQLAKAWENLLAKARKERITVRQAINRYNTQSDNLDKVLHVTGEIHHSSMPHYNSVKTESCEPCCAIPSVCGAMDFNEDQYNVEDASLYSARDQMGLNVEISELANREFCLGSRRLDTSVFSPPPPSASASDDNDYMSMYREQHQAKMTKLYWETLYWRTKYEREFGTNSPTENGNSTFNTSDSAGHGSSDDREN